MEITLQKTEEHFSRFDALANRLNLISFCFLCAYIFDCAWSGAGRWLMIGPISIRMLLLGIAILCSIPSLLTHIKKILTNVYILCLLGLLALLIVNAIRGVANGNDYAILRSDIKGFFYYAMLPTLLVTLNSRKRLERVMLSIVAGGGLLAFLNSAIFIDYVAFKMQIPVDMQYLYDVRIFAFNPTGGTLLRAFSFSGLYLIATCAFCFYLFITKKSAWRWVYPIITGISLFALMINFTRSLYLGLAVTIATVLISLPFLLRRYKGIWTFLLASALMFSLVLIPTSLAGGTNYLRYAVEKTLLSLRSTEELSASGESHGLTTSYTPEIEETFKLTAESDNLREMTVAELRKRIAEHPLIGRGLGAAIVCRDDGDTEYFYMNFIHKTGVIGLVVYLTPLFLLIVFTALRIFRHTADSLSDMKYLMLACLLGFMSTSIFTPYMNAALGVTMFSLTMAADSISEKEKGEVIT